MLLSKRLRMIASYIPPKMHVADIGSDHAFLLLHLVENEIVSKGIFGDIHEGPYKQAKERIEKMGYVSQIDVRLGDGLHVLKKNEAQIVVIAGMGGMLITRILDGGEEQLSSVKRLILQPNNGVHKVRRWLDEKGYTLVEEEIVYENNLLYEVLVCEPREDKEVTEYGEIPHIGEVSVSNLYKIGPLLLKKRHPLLQKKLAEELRKKEQIIEKMNSSSQEDIQSKRQEIQQEISIWKAVIQWLS